MKKYLALILIILSAFFISCKNETPFNYIVELSEEEKYVAGFSNGGFMSHRLAVQGKGTFSACICAGGDMSKSVWIRKRPKTKISFFQISGEKDDAIPKHSNGTAEASLDPAIEDVLEYYALSDGLNLENPAENNYR